MAPHGASPRPRSAPLTMCWPLSSCLASTLARRPSMWPRQSTTTVCRAGEPGHRAQSGWGRPGRAGALPRRSLPAGPPLLPPLLRPPSRCWLRLAGCWAAGYPQRGCRRRRRPCGRPQRRTCGILVLASWTSTHRPRKRRRQAAGRGLAAVLRPCSPHASSQNPVRALRGCSGARHAAAAFAHTRIASQRAAGPSRAAHPFRSSALPFRGRLPTESALHTIHGPLKDRAAPPSASPGHNGPAATDAAASGPSPSHR